MKFSALSRETAVDALILLLAFAFTLSFFKPELLLLDTAASGGDTGSLIYLGKYMHDYLLPHGQIAGWSPHRWLGFPIFHFQFPLPYLVIALLGYAIPLTVAFKLVTVVGVFSLPLCTYLMLRWMRFRFPTPAIGATLALFFLFNEKNTVFGGNIASMLAGEFSYSFSFSIMVLFLGFLYQSITTKSFSLWNAVLFIAMLFSHVVTAVVAAFSSLFFLLGSGKLRYRVKYLVVTYALAGLVLAFWLLPLVANVAYTTQYGRDWPLSQFGQWYPPEAIVFAALGAIGAALAIRKRDRRVHFLLFVFGVSVISFFLAEHLFAANIRFWPAMYYAILLLAAYALSEISVLLFSKRGLTLVPLIAVAATLVYLAATVSFVDDWIRWNYEGYEQKAEWSTYKELNEFIRNAPSEARTWNDLESKNDRLGTPRAFESIPYFTGKPTLEGVYAQATVSSPFISYAQCEMSSNCAGIPTVAGQERTTTHNLADGTIHMAIMNVKYYVAVNPDVKRDLAASADWKLVKKAGDWEVYELLTHNGSYVSVPDYEPNFIPTKDWKNTSLVWWTKPALDDVPLVFERGPFVEASLDDLKRIRMNAACHISEQVENERISFTTDCVGRPHIIKVSYFPKWHVEGAEKIYLVSPSFMLVYPTQPEVTLVYGDTPVHTVGKVLTLLGIALFILCLRNKRRVEQLLNDKEWVPWKRMRK